MTWLGRRLLRIQMPWGVGAVTALAIVAFLFAGAALVAPAIVAVGLPLLALDWVNPAWRLETLLEITALARAPLAIGAAFASLHRLLGADVKELDDERRAVELEPYLTGRAKG